MKFSPERSIHFNSSISSNSSLELIHGVSKLKSEDPKSVITLFLTSVGGSVTDSFAVYDYITRILKPKLQTVALGEISSMAALLFLMGEHRYISKLTIMRFHRFSMSQESSVTSIIAKKIADDLDRSETAYVDILTHRTSGRLTRRMANALLDDQVTLTASQVKKLGLAHEVI